MLISQKYTHSRHFKHLISENLTGPDKSLLRASKPQSRAIGYKVKSKHIGTEKAYKQAIQFFSCQKPLENLLSQNKAQGVQYA